jgi:hypothetical protein
VLIVVTNPKLTFHRREIAALAQRLNARGNSRFLTQDASNLAIDLKSASSLLRKWLANHDFESVEIELTNGLYPPNTPNPPKPPKNPKTFPIGFLE